MHGCHCSVNKQCYIPNPLTRCYFYLPRVRELLTLFDDAGDSFVVAPRLSNQGSVSLLRYVLTRGTQTLRVNDHYWSITQQIRRLA